jgi:uncharacterized protein (DUF433 family)
MMRANRKRLLTTAEAAVVAGIPVRSVNRAIDEKILPVNFFEADSEGGRRIRADGCVFLAFYFGAAGRLIAEERLRIIALASNRKQMAAAGDREKEWIIRQEFLSVDLAPFLRDVEGRLDRLRKAEALVVEDPEILSGTPVIRGTRVPVYDIAALAAAEPLQRILEDYPSIDGEAVALAQVFAEANPTPGRPPHRTSLPPGAVIIASYTVPASKRSLPRAS